MVSVLCCWGQQADLYTNVCRSAYNKDIRDLQQPLLIHRPKKKDRIPGKVSIVACLSSRFPPLLLGKGWLKTLPIAKITNITKCFFGLV